MLVAQRRVEIFLRIIDADRTCEMRQRAFDAAIGSVVGEPLLPLPARPADDERAAEKNGKVFSPAAVPARLRSHLPDEGADAGPGRLHKEHAFRVLCGEGPAAGP